MNWRCVFASNCCSTAIDVHRPADAQEDTSGFASRYVAGSDANSTAKARGVVVVKLRGSVEPGQERDNPRHCGTRGRAPIVNGC